MVQLGVFHAWYRHTYIPMHAPCTAQAYSQHNIISTLIDFVLAVEFKGKCTLLIQGLTVAGKWPKLVGRIGCKDRQLFMHSTSIRI